MKTLRFIGMAIVAIIMSVNFAACSDDDDDIDVAELLGLWEPIHAEGYWTEDDGTRTPFDRDINAASNDEDYTRIEFLGEGIYKAYYYYNGWQTEDAEDNLTYQISGNKIQIKNNTDNEVEESVIVSLTSNQLIVEWRDGEDYEKITYKRI